jgi:predicted MPP superfamily phosphohydrolase
MFILMLLGDLVWWRWAHRRVRGLWRWLLAAFTLTQLFYMLRILLTPFTARHDSNWINVAGTASAYSWHLLILPFTLLVIGVRAGFHAVTTKIRSRRNRVPEPFAACATRLHRREVLAAVPPLMAGAALTLSMGELHRFRVRRMEVPLVALPKSLDGMTIAHICDTHIGRFTDDAMLRNVADAANGLDADLAFFVGDLIDVTLADLHVGIDFARRLRAKFGVFMCEGNHDLIQDTTNNTHLFESTTRAAGLPMLFDETAIVQVRGQPVQILGGRWYRDWRTRNSSIRRLQQVQPGAFPIFLSHHPHGWDASATPLTLAGHTHGGQLMLTERIGVGPILFKYWSGLYQRDDQVLIVCNGAGNWFPVRTYAPAEIIHLTLRASG